MSTRPFARLVDEWVAGIGLRPEDDGTHSLRRTKTSIIDKQTGNLRAVQILLGRTKIESMVRYLGVARLVVVDLAGAERYRMKRREPLPALRHRSREGVAAW